MNGAPSGTVCNNTVEYGPYAANLEISPGNIKTYQNSFYTTQNSSIPAAGQGDSGGNVFRVVSDEVRVTGIISGMYDATTTCTGLSSGRLCSDELIIAGADAYFSNNLSWLPLIY